MKKSLFITITLLLFSLSSFSRVFRVGYNGTPLKGVDFTSITAANDSAKVGDTIQIYGSQGGSINKRLVILGFGYNFIAYPGLQADPGIPNVNLDNLSSVNSISLDIGSDSSIIEGCSGSIYVSSNNIIVRRCYSVRVFLYDNEFSINKLRIYSCYSITVTSYSSFTGLQNKFPSKNIEIFNCYSGTLTLNGENSTGSIINCYQVYPYNNEKSKILYKNSIVQYHVVYFPSNLNTIYDNNIFISGSSATNLPGSNNKYNVVQDSIFVFDPALNNSDENNYQLRPNSPAKNFGIDLSGNPTDCGIFGGELAYRYKIGGQPAIPAFYKLSAPTNAASSNPYNITVSVRSNN